MIVNQIVQGGGSGGISIDDIIEKTNFPDEVEYTGTHEIFDYTLAKTNIKKFSATKDIILRAGAFYNCTQLEELSVPNSTSQYTANYLCQGCTSLNKVTLTKIRSLGQNTFNGCTSLHTIVLPKVTALGNTFASGARLENVDLGVCSSIAGNEHFKNNSGLNVLILRKSDAICTLGNINTFTGTPFASGGTGGTLYVPNSLISSYQSANNWSTILGYANNQIKKIEGSYYETHYADGTAIS